MKLLATRFKGLTFSIRCLAVSSAVVLAACAAGPQAAADNPENTSSATASKDNLPLINLDEALLYQILASEIALQRGQPKAAYATYLGLAQKTRDPRLARRAVEIALLEQNLDRALESTRLWSELTPGNAQANQSLTILLVSKGDLAQAEPRLAERLADEKLRAGNRNDDADASSPFETIQRILQRAPDKLAAYQTMKRLFGNDLNNPDAQLSLAGQAHIAGLINESVEHAQRALQMTDSADAALSLAQYQQARDNNNVEATKTIEAYLARHPQADDVKLGLGRLYASEREWPKARNIFEQLLAKDPKNASLLHTLGLVAAQQPDREAARQYFEQYLLNRQPGDGRDVNTIYFTMSQLAEEARDWPDALAWLNRVAEGESRTDVITRRAGILSKQKQFAQAEKLIAQAKPKSDAERVQLALSEVQVLRDQDLNQKALKRLDTVLTQLPDQPDLLYEKAMVAERLNKLDILETSLRKVMAIRPDNPHAYNALGYSFADRNLRLDEARLLIEKALTLAPDDPYIMDSMGWVQFKQGQYDRAESTLRKAYTIKADNEIAIHLGEVLWTTGRRGEALVLWKEVGTREPDNNTLKEALKRLDVRL